VVNLDVAVVVAVRVALTVARQRRLHAGRLAMATALTANATSFLLPTSNLTTLLILGRAPLAAWMYADQSWLAWLLVTGLTIGALPALVNRGGQRAAPSATGERLKPSAPSQASASPGLLTSAAAIRGSASLALLDLCCLCAPARRRSAPSWTVA
jgi:Na+/H+ antiporter NhaD/arsenite permease-like protein